MYRGTTPTYIFTAPEGLDLTIDAGEEVAVRVRSRGNGYYGYVGTLTIIQTE